MSKLQNKVIAVTGAGSGIGRSLALRLARSGARLAIADRDAEGLDATGRLLGGNVPVLMRHFDVTEPGALQRFAEETREALGPVSGIVNNAGITVVGRFANTPPEDFARVMDVNFHATVEGTRAFLPKIRETGGEGWIVNISSIFGIIACPLQAAYNASKFAVRGFTEALRIELAQSDPAIRVVCVLPGGIKTSIARSAKYIPNGDGPNSPERFEALFRTSADDAADAIIRGMERGSPRVLIGSDARAVDLVQRLFPVRYFNIVGKLLA